MIGFAIAGTGSMADKMAATIAASADAKAVRVASSDPVRGRAFADRHAIAASGDVAAALADPAVGAIYIANRNADHARLSIAALAAGKPVLCEKPFACSVAEAETVIAAARSAGRTYMEAVATPFLPAVADAIARARAAGVERVEASFGYRADRARHPGLFASDSGVLLDRAVYPLTLALLILGPVASAVIDVDRDDRATDIAARFRLRHRGGGASDLAVSLVKRLANRLDIVTGHGRIAVPAPLLTARRITRHGPGPFAQNPLVRRLAEAFARAAGDWHPFGATPYAPELAHFCTLVRDDRAESPVLGHALMLEVQRLIEQARRS